MQTPPPTPQPYGVSEADYLRKNLTVVSHRLPITIKRSPDGQYDFQKSCDNLIMGMGGLAQDTKFAWYGWPGLAVPIQEKLGVEKALKAGYHALPVFIDDGLARRHDNGFSNSSLWPLLHHQPHLFRFQYSDWQAYYAVNRRFAIQVAQSASDGDFIWIHDYHLMLLPAMLAEEAKRRRKTLTVGFFLHTPFPSSEIFKIIPVWRDLLEGVLHSKLIGFQTTTYARNFRDTCHHLLRRKETRDGSIPFKGGFARTGVFPIGINPLAIIESLEQPGVQARMAALQQQYRGKKIIVGVDRLDPVHNIPQKLQALDIFLERYPEWIGKVVMIQITIPDRESSTKNTTLTREVHEPIIRINHKHGYATYRPIEYMHSSMSFEESTALYAASDVCMIASTSDGMNLTSFEYVASQKHRHGVLLLSEFAGAADLLNGCLPFHPWDLSEMADGICAALTRSKEQRKADHVKLEAALMGNTSADWGKKFLAELERLAYI